MLKLANMGPTEFRKYIQGKKIYIFGAGRALESCIDLYCRGKEVHGIIDNNSNLWGKKIVHESKEISIIGLETFIQKLKTSGIFEKSILLISSPFYAVEIVEELDKRPELDGLECFLQVLIRNTKEETEDFEFSQGENKIPKKIHYIWIGGKPLPYEFEKNIETWRQYNPDYEILCWNENNYDFTKCDYVREAYNSRQWSFASNYARLDIIHEHGGIYLDTDVEVLQSFDCLLKDEVFLNMGCADRLNLGCGFGASAGNKIIFDMRECFEEERFLYNDGQATKRTFSAMIHPIVERYGFEIENRYQKIDEAVLYPCEVMSPLTIEGLEDFISRKTVSIHKEAGTWKKNFEQDGMRQVISLLKNRILG